MKQVTIALVMAAFAISASSCHSTADRQHEEEMAAQQRSLDSMKLEMARNQAIDSMNEVARIQKEEEDARKAAVAHTSSSHRSSAPSRVSSSGSSSYSGSGYTEPAAAPVVQQEEQKKGWSAKAKGAVIGAGVGAASGAIINKRNRGVGALIGGVGGAAVGTGVGAVIDKKKGR